MNKPLLICLLGTALSAVSFGQSPHAPLTLDQVTTNSTPNARLSGSSLSSSSSLSATKEPAFESASQGLVNQAVSLSSKGPLAPQRGLPTPEPMSILAFASLGIPVLMRRRKKY